MRPLELILLLSLSPLPAACAERPAEVQRQFQFVSADFITSEPALVRWLNETTVIFSIGGRGTTLGTECWPERLRDECNQKLSIQLWDLNTNRVSTFLDDARLHCVSSGRITIIKGSNFHTGLIDGPLIDTGLEAGNNYDWDRCIPSLPVTTVDKGGITTIHLKQHWDYYDFRSAYFRATRYEFPRATIFWKDKNGSEEKQELFNGPWNLSGRLWEFYIPTKAGVIVADQPHNYWVETNGYSKFFPGAISSLIGVSPSGCQVSFFGAKFYESPRKTEVRLYATRVC